MYCIDFRTTFSTHVGTSDGDNGSFESNGSPGGVFSLKGSTMTMRGSITRMGVGTNSSGNTNPNTSLGTFNLVAIEI